MIIRLGKWRRIRHVKSHRLRNQPILDIRREWVVFCALNAIDVVRDKEEIILDDCSYCFCNYFKICLFVMSSFIMKVSIFLRMMRDDDCKGLMAIIDY